MSLHCDTAHYICMGGTQTDQVLRALVASVDSSVGVVTDYRLNGWHSITEKGQGFFSTPQNLN
jgi:hypothetical protein